MLFAGISLGTNGQREFVGGMLLVVGFLLYLHGAGYVSLLLVILPEAWSEGIGKVMMVIGTVLIISAAGIIFH